MQETVFRFKKLLMRLKQLLIDKSYHWSIGLYPLWAYNMVYCSAFNSLQYHRWGSNVWRVLMGPALNLERTECIWLWWIWILRQFRIPDSKHYSWFFALFDLCYTFVWLLVWWLLALPSNWSLHGHRKKGSEAVKASAVVSDMLRLCAIRPYFSAFFAMSVFNGVVICFLYSKLDKYQRRSQQIPIHTHQVAPVQVATVPQPQTVLVNGQTMRVVSNGNQQIVTTTNNPNMVVMQPSQTVRINQPPSYQVVV